MEMLSAAMILYERIYKIEPNLALDIVYRLLLNGIDYQYMIGLIHSPIMVIASLVEDMKFKMVGCYSTPMSLVSPSLQPTTDAIHDSSLFSIINHSKDPTPSSHHVPSLPFLNPPTYDYAFQLWPVNDTPSSNGNGAVEFQEPQVKACHHYYSKGFCKYGPSCRYSHGHSASNAFSNANHYGGVPGDNGPPSPGSLNELETELVELLKSKEVVSLADLRSKYFMKYGKHLQAEGYLTESQRHGKAGFSLRKLIARMNSFQIIERPYGQHLVVLAEDASKHSETLSHVEFGSETPKNSENRVEVSGSSSEASSSQKVYLTFPAESTFTAADVSNYFNQFGAVIYVKLSRSPERDYGFVAFVHPESAKRVLSKGTHNICGAQVLAKTYDPTKGKKNDKNALQMHRLSQNLQFCDRYHASPRATANSMGMHIKEEQQRVHALETRRSNHVSLPPIQLALPRYSYEIGESISSQGSTEIQSLESPLSSHSVSLKCYTANEDRYRSFDNFSLQESLFDYPPGESNDPTSVKEQ